MLTNGKIHGNGRENASGYVFLDEMHDDVDGGEEEKCEKPRCKHKFTTNTMEMQNFPKYFEVNEDGRRWVHETVL